MMRPSTPNLNVYSHVGPSSPPQTPTAPSHSGPPLLPLHRRSAGPKTPKTPKTGAHHRTPGPMSQQQQQQHNIKPLGNGQFSYTRPIRPEELSPNSSHSSSAGPGSEAETSEQPHSPMSPRRTEPPTQFVSTLRTAQVISHIEASFTVEELSDFDEFDIDERLDVIRPYTIEYAGESDRSRSRSRDPPEDPPPQLDRHMINNLRNLKCTPDSSDESDLDDEQYQALLKLRAEKRRKRMSQGSIGKRTISERGSDDDREDLRHSLEFNEAGSSARRLKRRVGNRGSLLFNDPPERIEEMDEPEELDDSELLAKELPFYLFQSMEVDSP